ncbi:MAG: HPP family protein [Holophagaceae bacterium]|nr:HPP family protein [Holophagaceae bacterium]
MQNPDPKNPPKPQGSLILLEPEVTRKLVQKYHLTHFLGRFPERPVWAAFMFVNGFISIGLLALTAKITRTPFIFPSLGPTAFLFFFSPASPTASPRHTILGHAIGIACGYGALLLFGLAGAPAQGPGEMVTPRILAATLSLAGTGALMILLRAAHPPAGATALIISLGFITRPTHLLALEAAVILMTLQAIAINRLAGLDYPLWAKRHDESPSP